MLPAVGFALKPQLQIILAKSLSFEDAEQLMCGNGETPRKGIWEKALDLSSKMALEASIASVSHAFAFFVLWPFLWLAAQAVGILTQSGCRTPKHLLRDTCAPTGQNKARKGAFNTQSPNAHKPPS